MKYIKNFEEKGSWLNNYQGDIDGRFWLIPTGEKLGPALKKINAPINLLNELEKQTKSVFVGQYNNNWSWELFSNGFSLYLDSGYTYQGAVNVEKWEIEEYKYNL